MAGEFLLLKTLYLDLQGHRSWTNKGLLCSESLQSYRVSYRSILKHQKGFQFELTALGTHTLSTCPGGKLRFLSCVSQSRRSSRGCSWFPRPSPVWKEQAVSEFWERHPVMRLTGESLT